MGRHSQSLSRGKSEKLVPGVDDSQARKKRKLLWGKSSQRKSCNYLNLQGGLQICIGKNGEILMTPLSEGGKYG